MITQNSINREVPFHWLDYLASAVRDPKQLLMQLEIPIDSYEQHFTARKLFPLFVPQPFIDKMEKGNPLDPLLLQVMTKIDEFEQVDGFEQDPLQEQQSAVPNIIHKYRSRVLLMVKGGCAVNCRYCFRRHFPYQDNPSNKSSWQTALDYVASDLNLDEVILSGGDPLMAKDQELSWLIEHIEKIPHINKLRIHTRLPVVIPQRINDELCQMLVNTRLTVVMVTHINHPNEIDDLFISAMNKLRANNVILLNQSVLLKGVNDSAVTLKELGESLIKCGILPYYLHLLDKVQGASHFYIEDHQAQSLYSDLQSITSGYLVPKLVREEPHKTNKTLIL